MSENGSPIWVENCLYEKTLSFSYEELPHTGKMKIQYEKFQVFDMKVLHKVFQIKTIKMPTSKNVRVFFLLVKVFDSHDLKHLPKDTYNLLVHV